MDYRIVDVFAQGPFTGNPLTVLPDAGDLDAATMQRIANETNHSETTFVLGEPEPGVFETRIFTPQTELPFAGHPTLGTAHVLGGDVTLRLQAGDIPVRREGDALWMAQNPAMIGPALDAALLERITGVPPVSATVASTGTPVGLMEVATSDDVRAATLDLAAYRAAGAPDIAVLYVFTQDPDVPGIDIHARSLAQFVGIPEDAATGGAAGPLAGWLAHRDGDIAATIGQGIEMGRHSRIHIRCDGGRPEVGGRVVDVATGRFTV